jgi:hypothetical protein
MKLDVIKPPLKFAIVGLPRSGTTILNKVLHSCKECFSASEPHWLYDSEQAIDIDGFKEFFNLQKKPSLKTLLPYYFAWAETEQNYNAIGVKETFRTFNIRAIKAVSKLDLDFILVTNRNPRYVFGSWKSMTNWHAAFPQYNLVDWFIEHTLALERWLEKISSQKRCYIVDYLQFCKDPLSYLNLLLEGHIMMHGPLNLANNEFVYGDKNANQKTRTINLSTKQPNLSSEEEEKIEQFCMPVYTSMREHTERIL